MLRKKKLAVLIALAIGVSGSVIAAETLVGRAVLSADTFASGPTSGQYIGGGANGRAAPFVNKQPVQGFSAVLKNTDGTFLAMADNGFGSMENSADFNLRVYRILPHFKTRKGGAGNVQVLGFFELHDPDRKIPFSITNHFSDKRVLTGSDFDIESMQRAPDGTFWFGDEFGPFLLHTDASGRVLEAPIALPDFQNPGKELRSPQNQFSEESSAVRVMNAMRAHAKEHGANTAVVFSPWHVMLDDKNTASFVDNRKAPPAGSGLEPASSEIFNVKSIQQAGFPVVTWTVNDKARMLELMKLGVNGIISDRPDLLLQAAREYDANGDGVPGDFLGADGLIDIGKFDAQAHRGGRNLRPENTLPSMEVGLDNLMNTLETDNGVSMDGVPMLDHDPYIEAKKCRHVDGTPYTAAAQLLMKDLTQAQIQSRFICDNVFRGPEQTNDVSLSPVTVAFAAQQGLLHPYVMPSTQQLFDFVKFYVGYYKSGLGASHPDAEKRWKNAERVRFNIETKINPRAEFAARTIGHEPFAAKVAGVIAANGMQTRADIQSFDFRTLLDVHKTYPAIRTVALFGDFPIYADTTLPGSDDGTNLQDEHGANTPWLAGLYWPYRVTRESTPFRVERSGGFEGMALSSDGEKLYPLLERPIAGDDSKTLLIHEFDLEHKQYTGKQFKYQMDVRGSNIGDFILYNHDMEGLVIERDNSQGDLNGFKKIFRVKLDEEGSYVEKKELVDLLKLNDPHGISQPVQTGDVGTGTNFAFPFVTIEDVVVLDEKTLGVINDNNYPFSVGRHVGSRQPDDNEFIKIKLDHPLKLDHQDHGKGDKHKNHDE